MKWLILGAYELNLQDDYPDFVVPLAKAIADKEVDRGIAVCGSGVGASCSGKQNIRRKSRIDQRSFLGPSGCGG